VLDDTELTGVPGDIGRASAFVATGLLIVLLDIDIGGLRPFHDALGAGLVLFGLGPLLPRVRDREVSLAGAGPDHAVPSLAGALGARWWWTAVVAWTLVLLYALLPGAEAVSTGSFAGSGPRHQTLAAAPQLAGAVAEAVIALVAMLALAQVFASLVDDPRLVASWRRSARLQVIVAVPALVVSFGIAAVLAPPDGTTAQLTGPVVVPFLVSVLAVLLTAAHVLVSAFRTARARRADEPVS
jgi:hypothetical protein